MTLGAPTTKKTKARRGAGESLRVRRPTAEIAAATLVMNVLALAFPILTLQVYDRIIPDQAVDSLYVLCAGVVVAMALELVLGLCRTYLVGWAGATVEHQMACRLMQKMLRVEPGYLARSGVGTHMQRFTAISTLKGFYDGDMLITLLETVFLVLFIGMIALVGGSLVWVPLAVLALFALVSMGQGAYLRRWLGLRNEYDNRRYDFLIESLKGIHTIKALCVEQIFERRYEFMEKQSTLANYAIANMHGTLFNSAAVFSNLMVVAVMCTGALHVIYGHMSVGILVACIMLSGRLMQPVQKLLQLWVRSQDFAVARKQLEEIFSLPTRTHTLAFEAPEKRGRLVLRDVQLKDPDGKLLLEHVTLDVKAGEAVLLDSRDAVARGQLLRIMAGMQRADKGEVLLEGLTLRAYPRHEVATYVGMLPFNAPVFRGSIYQNLTRFGRVGEGEAMEMARLFEIPAEVARLPHGFDTLLEGTKADTIPLGLKQRIAMAGILATKPRVILFENAGQGLDHRSHDILCGVLKALAPSSVLVLVTQDPDMRALATRQVVLYRGVVLARRERGTEKAGWPHEHNPRAA